MDNGIGLTTAYDALAEVTDLLAAQAPDLSNALRAAEIAGYTHVSVDGTVVVTDRVSEPGPTPITTTGSGPRRTRVDLWWSGKNHCHGGNIQVVTAPDGWPLWTSPVRPGREHDVTALRTHPGMFDAFAE